MHRSIWDSDVEAVFEEARVAGVRRVEVGGEVVEIQVPFASPEDWRDVWIYFLMVDRFNNAGAVPRHLPWNAEFWDFQGGTIEGVRQQLDYLQGLGAGAVWITPVLKNAQYSASYHGYGIQDFLSIEPRFASDVAKAQQDPTVVENELRRLVDEAHARGMYVILDMVLHHVGDVFAYKDFGSVADWSNTPYAIYWRDEHGQPRTDWTEAPSNPPANAAVGPKELLNNNFFLRQGNAFSTGGQPAGDFFSLKALASDFQDGTGYPVRDILIRAYQYIIARYDIDGFRIDTLKYISPDFARVFGNAMREFALSIGKKNFFTFGEVYDDEEKIAQFIGRNTQVTEAGDIIGVDAALDFPLFYHLPGVCKGLEAPSDVVSMYEQRRQVERDVLSSHGDATGFFVTFLDNHDQTARFYYRDPKNPDTYDDQVSLAVGCLFALPGIPCLYYGTEQGLSDSGDAPEAVREALWGKPNAFDWNSVFYRAISQLTTLRNNSPALRYGRHYFRPTSEDSVHFGISSSAPGVLAFSRILNDVEVVVVANTSTVEGWRGEVIIDYSINSRDAAYSILFSNKAKPGVPGPVAEKAAGSVQITEVDGSVTDGPVRVLPVNLQSMEIQILGTA